MDGELSVSLIELVELSECERLVQQDESNSSLELCWLLGVVVAAFSKDSMFMNARCGLC